MNIESQVIRDRLYRLNDALSSLGETKILQDKYEALILQVKADQDKLRQEIVIVEGEKIEALQQVAEQQLIINELQSANKKLTEERDRNLKLFTGKLEVLTYEKEKAIETKKQAVDDLFKAQKQLTNQQNEIETFNIKIAKLRQRRNVDLNKKLC